MKEFVTASPYLTETKYVRIILLHCQCWQCYTTYTISCTFPFIKNLYRRNHLVFIWFVTSTVCYLLLQAIILLSVITAPPTFPYSIIWTLFSRIIFFIRFSDCGDCSILILACDGVWDVMTDQEAADLLMKRFVEKGGPDEDAAKYIVRTAIKRGSSDNITAIIVYL